MKAAAAGPADNVVLLWKEDAMLRKLSLVLLASALALPIAAQQVTKKFD